VILRYVRPSARAVMCGALDAATEVEIAQCVIALRVCAATALCVRPRAHTGMQIRRTMCS
jgi:hypothetical protein